MNQENFINKNRISSLIFQRRASKNAFLQKILKINRMTIPENQDIENISCAILYLREASIANFYASIYAVLVLKILREIIAANNC